MSFLNPDSKVMTFLGRVADYLILTLLWLLCSIPIFTIGASTTALFYASFKLLDDEAPYVSKCFFKSFKENFKLSTLLWLFALAVLAFFLVDIQFYTKLEAGTMRFIGTVVFSLLLILYLITMLYLFPYVSRFHCTFKQAIKISLLLGVRHLPTTILIVVLDAAVIYGCLYYIALFMFLPGILCLVNSFLIRRIFKKYMPEKEEVDGDSFATIEEIEARDAQAAEATVAEDFGAETDEADINEVDTEITETDSSEEN